MLSKIFDEEELPNYKIYETAQLVVHDYMDKKNCKVDAVAAELGTTSGTLYRQLNPKDTLMPLNIDRILAISRLTKDNRIIESISSEVDLISIPRVATKLNTAKIDVMCDLNMIASNKVFNVSKEALVDKKLTREEQSEILKRIEEKEVSLANYKASIQNAEIYETKDHQA